MITWAAVAVVVVVGFFLAATMHPQEEHPAPHGDITISGYSIQSAGQGGGIVGSERISLLHEEPGKPALTKQLRFDYDSMCINESSANPCAIFNAGDALLYSGRRITVVGTPVGTSTLLVKSVRFDEPYSP